MWLHNFKRIDISPTEDKSDPLIDIDLFDSHYSNPDLSDNNWNSINLPENVEKTLGTFDGVICFRKIIEIPSTWEGQNLTLSLGPINNRDVVWFNGIKIDSATDASKGAENKNYTIDGALVKEGKVVIAVRVIDTSARGGIYGNRESIKIYPEKKEQMSISLTGEWKYEVIAEIQDNQIFIFDPGKTNFNLRPKKSITIDANTPSVLYNGMIAPLTSYNIKGVIWYQGESNVGRAGQYTKLMETLITDWRKNFNVENLPFYFVQIAPYKYSATQNEESALLREAQRKILETENTGMVVTLDIGNVENVHPADKKSVGERLALWALAKDYGIDVVYSGPLFNGNVKINKNILTVEFDYADNGLEIRDKVPNQFEIAGENGIFYPAKAMILNNNVTLSSSKVSNPVVARYAFKNGSEGSLFNKSGLPASSFTSRNY